MKWYHYMIVGCILNTLFRYSPFCFQFGDPAENHTSYAVGQALSYLCLLQIIPKRDLVGKWWKWYMVVFWCAVSNLMDELFFNPLELGANEIVFVVIILIQYIFSDWINTRWSRLITFNKK